MKTFRLKVVLVITLCIGVLLAFAGVLVGGVLGPYYSELPPNTIVYEIHGKYYWTDHVRPAEAYPNQEISYDRYRTFKAYQDQSAVLGGIGVGLALVSGGSLILIARRNTGTDVRHVN